MKIGLVIFEQFTDLDLFLPWDLLNRVRSVGGVTDWEVKILGTADSHMSDAGLRVPTMGLIDEAREADAVLFASGVRVPDLVQDRSYLDRFQLSLHRQLIGSMCSGAVLLAALGFLTGKQATTYPTRRELLKSYGVDVVDRDFVTDGRVATAAGCLAGMQLSEWVIASLINQEMADRVLKTVQPVGKGL
jgi:transcriptional regulator GlxA family with amidase domain